MSALRIAKPGLKRARGPNVIFSGVPTEVKLYGKDFQKIKQKKKVLCVVPGIMSGGAGPGV